MKRFILSFLLLTSSIFANERSVNILLNREASLSIVAKGLYIASRDTEDCRSTNKVTKNKSITILNTLVTGDILKMNTELGDDCQSKLSGISLFFSTKEHRAYSSKYISLKKTGLKKNYHVKCEVNKKSLATNKTLSGLYCSGDLISLDEQLSAAIKVSLN